MFSLADLDAIEADTKLLMRRDGDDAVRFMDDLRSRLANRVQLFIRILVVPGFPQIGMSIRPQSNRSSLWTEPIGDC
jgi:hypothetical protein